MVRKNQALVIYRYIIISIIPVNCKQSLDSSKHYNLKETGLGLLWVNVVITAPSCSDLYSGTFKSNETAKNSAVFSA